MSRLWSLWYTLLVYTLVHHTSSGTIWYLFTILKTVNRQSTHGAGHIPLCGIFLFFEALCVVLRASPKHIPACRSVVYMCHQLNKLEIFSLEKAYCMAPKADFPMPISILFYKIKPIWHAANICEKILIIFCELTTCTYPNLDIGVAGL